MAVVAATATAMAVVAATKTAAVKATDMATVRATTTEQEKDKMMKAFYELFTWFKQAAGMDDKIFRYGDRVTCGKKSATYLYENRSQHHIIFSGQDHAVIRPFAELTAGWSREPEVYQRESLDVYDDGYHEPFGSFVYIPKSFSGKKVKVKIEEIL